MTLEFGPLPLVFLTSVTFCFPFVARYFLFFVLITFARFCPQRRRLLHCGPPGAMLAIFIFFLLRIANVGIYALPGYKFVLPHLFFLHTTHFAAPPKFATIFYMSLLCMLLLLLKTYNFLKRFPFALMSLIKFEVLLGVAHGRGCDAPSDQPNWAARIGPLTN